MTPDTSSVFSNNLIFDITESSNKSEKHRKLSVLGESFDSDKSD